MNIDERLEAFTQSLELVAAMRRDDEQRSEREFKKLREQFAQHEQLFGQIALRLRETSGRVDKVEDLLERLTFKVDKLTDNLDSLARQTATRLSEVTESIDVLARIAGVHQDRLDGHEQKLKDLERPRN